MEDTKRCSKCGEVKPVGEFYRYNRSPSGRQCYCRLCSDNYKKRYSPNDKRGQHLRSRYGITMDGFNAILVSQGHCCKICGKHEDDETGPLRVDHDHVTGKVRGLLCHSCNIGIGHLGDSPETVMNAYEYLLHNGESADAVLGILGDETTMLAQAGDHIPESLKPLTETGAA